MHELIHLIKDIESSGYRKKVLNIIVHNYTQNRQNWQETRYSL